MIDSEMGDDNDSSQSGLIDNDLLITLVEQRPVMWDKTLDVFKDRDATRNAWREVCHELRSDFPDLDDKEKNLYGKEVLKRWKNLRDSFAKSEKKMKEAKKSGSKATKKRKYIFTDELQFLKKVYTGREVVDSHDNDECVTEGGNSDKDTDKDKDKDKDPPAANEKRGPTNTTRKHNKMDEVDIKIIKALETPKEKPNSSMLFFESLLPMIENFNREENIQLQMGVLNVVSTIVNKQTQVSRNQHHRPPVAQQQAPYYHQPYNDPGTSQYYFNHQHPSSFYQPHAGSPITKPPSNQTNMFPITQTQVKKVVHPSTSMPAERVQETPVSPLSRVDIDKAEQMANVRQFVETFIAVEDERSSSAHTETSSLSMDLYQL